MPKPDKLPPQRKVTTASKVDESSPAESPTEPPVEPKPEAKARWYKRLSRRQKIWFSLLIIVVAGIATVALTDLRYRLLGLFLKGQVQVSVVDSTTSKPLAGVQATIAQTQATSDSKGNIVLNRVQLGRHPLTLAKPGYQSFTDTVAVFIGHNNFGQVRLVSVGIPVSFKVTESIGNQPLVGATVSSGSDNELSAADGTVSLNLPPGDQAQATVSLKGFTPQTLNVKLPPRGVVAVKLVPSVKDYFLSNRSGRMDLYQSNVDGSNQSILLAGTGKENSSTSILTSDDASIIALLSSREGQHTPGGDLLPMLYLVNPSSAQLTKISSDVGIALIGWVDHTLIYSTYASGTSRVLSYNANNGQTLQLAAAPNFAATELLDGRFYYSVDDVGGEIGLYTILPNGADKRHIFDQPANLTRTARSVITFSSSDNSVTSWYTYDDTGSGKLTKLAGEPPLVEDRYLALNASGDQGAVVLVRDGRQEIYLTDSNGQNEKRLTTIGSVQFVQRWIDDNYLIFRVSNPTETADYIVNVTGGPAVKISDVYSGGSFYGY